MSCRYPLAAAIFVLAVSGAPRAQQRTMPSFELDEASVSSLQEGMASGRYTSRRLVEL
jgi:hypothetical protein